VKFLLLAVASLTSPLAMAGALDVADPYENRPFLARPDSTCKDGQSQLFVESVNGLDRYVNVIRTCKNGVYYPRTITKNKNCKDGATGFWSSPKGPRYGEVQYTCVGGRYVRQ